jgi:hypothetical protein
VEGANRRDPGGRPNAAIPIGFGSRREGDPCRDR